MLPPGLTSSCPHQRSPQQPLGSSTPCSSDATAGPGSSSPQPGSAWSWVLLDQDQAEVLLLQVRLWAQVLACPCSCLCPFPGRCLGLVLPRCPQLPCSWPAGVVGTLFCCLVNSPWGALTIMDSTTAPRSPFILPTLRHLL